MTFKRNMDINVNVNLIVECDIHTYTCTDITSPTLYAKLLLLAGGDIKKYRN